MIFFDKTFEKKWKILKIRVGPCWRKPQAPFFRQKNHFFENCPGSKIQFFIKNCYLRDIAKWLAQWVYSRKMLPGTGYKISVRIFLAMFMTSGNLTQFFNSKCEPRTPKIIPLDPGANCEHLRTVLLIQRVCWGLATVKSCSAHLDAFW